MDAARTKLKIFIEGNIPFNELKKEGFFKGIRKTDYEKIAARVCQFFGFKSIYEFKRTCRGKMCNNPNCDGNSEYCRQGNYKAVIKELKPNYPEMVTQEKWLN